MRSHGSRVGVSCQSLNKEMKSAIAEADVSVLSAIARDVLERPGSTVGIFRMIRKKPLVFRLRA
jgi:hypothetical protein